MFPLCVAEHLLREDFFYFFSEIDKSTKGMCRHTLHESGRSQLKAWGYLNISHKQAQQFFEPVGQIALYFT